MARILLLASLLAVSWLTQSPGTATADVSITTLDTTGDVGSHASLALDASGNPVIAYYDATDGDLKLARCSDPVCQGTVSITTPDSDGDVGWHPSLVLDKDGHPVVTYFDITNAEIKLLRCGDSACDSEATVRSITSPDTQGTLDPMSSLKLDAAGNPVIAYSSRVIDEAEFPGFVWLARCQDSLCDTVTYATPVDGVLDSVGPFRPSLALDAAGNPVVAYRFANFPPSLGLLHCADPNCQSPGNVVTHVLVDTAASSFNPYLRLNGADNPVIVYAFTPASFPQLAVLPCNNPDCQGLQEQDTILNANPYGLLSDSNGNFVLNPMGFGIDGGGNLVIPFADGGFSEEEPQENLRIAYCQGESCEEGERTIVTPVPGLPHTPTSMVLDANGNPVFTLYGNPERDLLLLRCDNPDCSSENGGGPDTDPSLPPECAGMTFDNTIEGTAGNDVLMGGSGRDLILGGGGNNVIFGGGGGDCLVGGDGSDVLIGGNGNDVLVAGGGGAKLLLGGNGDDRLYGGEGHNVLLGGNGQDTCSGGDIVQQCEDVTSN